MGIAVGLREWTTPAGLAVCLCLLLTLCLGDTDGFFDVGDFQNEGDTCFHLRYRVNGVCKYLSDCASVYSDLDDKLVFPQICGFSSGRNLIPNICCVPDGTEVPQKQSFLFGGHPAPRPTSMPQGGFAYPNAPAFQAPPRGPSNQFQVDSDKIYFGMPPGVQPAATTTAAPRPAQTTEYGMPYVPPVMLSPAVTSSSTDDGVDQPFRQQGPGQVSPLEFPPKPSEMETTSTTRRPTTTTTSTTRRPTTTTTTTTRRPTTTTTTTRRPTTTTTTTSTTTMRPTTTTTTTMRPTTTTTTTRRPTTTTTTTSTTTMRPTTTTTTTMRPTTTTTRRPTTTTTRRPRTTTASSPARRPLGPRPPCFTDVPPPPAANEEIGKSATAVIRLRESSEETLPLGDVMISPNSQENFVEPDPEIPPCTSDDDCDGWTTSGWTRERRQVFDDYPLEVDEQVQVQVTTTRSGQVFLGLCSDRSCAVVRVTQVDDAATNSMKFDTLITPTGNVMDSNARVIMQSEGGPGSIPSGRRYTFVVHRRTEGLLDVWLDQQPFNKATVALQDDMALLRGASSAGTLSFVQGQAMDGYHMDIDEQVSVQLNVTRDGLLDLGLCGDTSCSVVRVTGVSDGSRMGYSTRITKTNSVAEERAQVLQTATGPDSFPLNQSYMFVVMRRSEWIMDVWLQNDPGNKVTVPLEPDRLRLKVDSDAGSTSFVRERPPDGFMMSVNKLAMVRLLPVRDSGWLDVALCGAASCSVIRLLGAGEQGQGLGYSTRITPTNSVSDPNGIIKQPEGAAGFTVGRPVTLVLRRTTEALELWREDDASRTASVAISESALQLKTSSTVGSTTLIQVVSDGYLMDVGQMVLVRLVVTREDGWLFMGLCSATSCSSIGIVGVSDDSRLSYNTRITNSNSIIGDGSVWQTSLRGAKKFASGKTHNFVVHRRTASLMDVWLVAAPSRKVTVPLEDDRSMLKVVSDAGDVFVTKDAAPVQIGYPLAVGEEVAVQITPTKDSGWVFFAMCGGKACSVVGVGGAADQQIDAATKITTTNNLLGPGSLLEESSGPNTFTTGSTYMFRIQRRTSQLLAVWMEDAADQTTITVPLDADRTYLQVLSSVGSAKFVQGRAVDGYRMGIDERVLVRFEPRASATSWLSVGLCGEESCGVVRVSGVDGDARPRFTVRRTATNSIVDDASGDLLQDMSGTQGFSTNKNYTFVLHRHSPMFMDLWLQDNPGAKITVPLLAEQTLLKVDSNSGSTYTEKHGAADGWMMVVGARAWVTLAVDNSNGRLQMGLCSHTECRGVRVTGVEGSTMGFSTAVISTNSVSGRGEDLQTQTGPMGFTLGRNHTFIVHRRSVSDLDVWLEDDPNNKATVPLSAGAELLKVSSSAGSTAFVRGQRWVSQPASTGAVVAALESPALPGRPGDRPCVSVQYLANSKKAPLLLSAHTDRERTTPLAAILPDQSGSWRHSRVVVTLPQDSFNQWRLVLSAPTGMQIGRVGSCDLGNDDVVTVGEPPSEDYAVPEVGPGSWTSADDSANRCSNGGREDSTSRSCTCPAGFAGPMCQSGCGPNAFGGECESRCAPDSAQGCRGLLLCVAGNQCACAPGFKGSRCDQTCGSGEFGAGCLQSCPQCRGGDTCDPYTGRCQRC